MGKGRGVSVRGDPSVAEQHVLPATEQRMGAEECASESDPAQSVTCAGLKVVVLS